MSLKLREGFAGRLRRLLLLLVAVWLAGVVGAGAAPPVVLGRGGAAQEVPATARLFPAGQDTATGRYRAVVEIALAEGYKTYWREPGDSGVPTTFDWEGSENVAGVEALYPTPVRFFDGVGHAIGYTGTVRFPLEVTPAAAGQPVELRLVVDFGVCRDVCIPEQATLSATLSDIAQVAGLWEDAVALLPARAGASGNGTEIVRAHFERQAAAGGELHLAVTGPGGGAPGEVSDIFVEGPAGWRFGRPVPAPGVAKTFTVPVRYRAFDAPVDLTVTLTGAGGAVETRVTIDPSE